MLCKIYRWKVSGAIDSGKPMPDAVKRHLLRCASCREFAAAAEDVGRRLSRDAEILTGPSDQAFADRIKASLGDRAEAPESSPVVSLRPKPTLRLRPVMTAAVALVIVGASVLYVVTSRPQPTQNLTPPFQIEEPGTYLIAAVQKVNSPYEKEMQLWKETFDGAARRLEAAFDIGFGETR